MPYTLSNPYIPKQPLGGDGAWTDLTPIGLPPSAKTLGVLVQYTGGSASGAVKLRVRRGIEEEGSRRALSSCEAQIFDSWDLMRRQSQ